MKLKVNNPEDRVIHQKLDYILQSGDKDKRIGISATIEAHYRVLKGPPSRKPEKLRLVETGDDPPTPKGSET